MDCESSVDGKCKLLGGNCTPNCQIPGIIKTSTWQEVKDGKLIVYSDGNLGQTSKVTIGEAK